MTSGDITSALTILVNAITQLLGGLTSTFPFNIFFGALVGVAAITLLSAIIGIFHTKKG